MYYSVFGTSDWFETTEEEGCDNPPDNDDGDDGGDDGGDDDDEVEFDGRDNNDGDENDPQTEKFFSLQGVNVCDGVRQLLLVLVFGYFFY